MVVHSHIFELLSTSLPQFWGIMVPAYQILGLRDSSDRNHFTYTLYKH